MATIYTIGHSNTPTEKLLEQLGDAGIKTLVDIRRYPGSRRNPQFNAAALTASLSEAGVDYVHAETLGGRRSASKDSINNALTNDGFRGYADYMREPAFDKAIDNLISMADRAPTAVMCAEAVPWRCHRSLLADALTARGHMVIHLISGKQQPHHLTPVARIAEGELSYPALI